jgi:hypothetical protein
MAETESVRALKPHKNKRGDRFMVGFARAGNTIYGRDDKSAFNKSRYADPMTLNEARRYLVEKMEASQRPILACVYELVPVAVYELHRNHKPILVETRQNPQRAGTPVQHKTNQS